MNYGAAVSTTISEITNYNVTMWANHKIRVDITTRARAGEMPTLRSSGTKTGHVVQNLRAPLVVFGVIWYSRDAPT